jgi:hypothetical protein
MQRSSVPVVTVLCCLSVWMTGLFPLGPAHSQPGYAISITNSARSIQDATFASKEDAQQYLAQYLPKATAGNPNYRTNDPDLAMAWITKAIQFGPSANANGILVSMSEEVLEFRKGVRGAPIPHKVEFPIEDVQVSELTDSPDVTENGEKSIGIIFRCNSGKCMRSTYNGASSMVDWGDISIQDATSRGNILKALQTIKRAAGDRKS